MLDVEYANIRLAVIGMASSDEASHCFNHDIVLTEERVVARAKKYVEFVLYKETK